MVLSFLFYAFLIYLAWKLVFGLIIPLVRATRRVRKTFREMREQMQQGPQPFASQNAAHDPRKGASEDDYIEFEEIR